VRDAPSGIGDEAFGTTLELDQPLPPQRAAAQSMLGQRVGQYRLQQVIASGGMGTVYLAHQEHPRRAVAVKLMRHGVMSRSLLRRFEFEAQVLARLRHPNIAQVYEAGTHDDGSGGVPYFVMEYVPNAQALIEYAVHRRLSIRDRLELFGKVCDAVHHGHQKGVMHRDLKPPNILVDSNGEPKIIDFGVARATDSDMTATTVQTELGQLVGTLQYMSPEQCDADPHDLDTRSDVYALGVVLYELLTERLPYDVRRVAIHEAARVIRDETPARPSSISRVLRGDVETIALKALEKDRTRRYQSTRDLSEDIRRYLNDEPIQARPPSVAYQARKFARRHRAACGALVSIAAVLIAATTISIVFLVRANAAREALAVEVDMRRDAQAAAEQKTLVAETVNEFLNEDLLLAVDPALRGIDVTVLEILDSASESVPDRFVDQPVVEAGVRNALGRAYLALGVHAKALPHLERSSDLYHAQLGPEHPDSIRALVYHAMVLWPIGELDAADDLYARAETLASRVLSEDHDVTLVARSGRGLMAWHRGDFQAAHDIIEPCVDDMNRALGSDHQHTLAAANTLAITLMDLDRMDEAEVLFNELLETHRKVHGPEHPETLQILNNLANLYWWRNEFERAAPILEEVLAVRRVKLGPTHPETIRSLSNLAVTYESLGRYDKAVDFRSETISALRQNSNDADFPLDANLWNLGYLLVLEGRGEEAEAALRECLSIRLEATERDERRIGNAQSLLAGALYLHRAGLSEDARREAERLLDEGVPRTAVRPDAHKKVTDAIRDVVIGFYRTRDDGARVEYYQSLLAPLEE
jgi:non-specific serine/threonine protein kinase/serine/threonine-protein kinase